MRSEFCEAVDDSSLRSAWTEISEWARVRLEGASSLSLNAL